MKILKFGGTSLSNAKNFFNVVTIIEKKSQTEQVAVVLSAPEKITNLLISTIDNRKDKKKISIIIDEIKNFFLKLVYDIKQIEKKIIDTKILEIINNKFLKLNHLFQEIYFLKKCPDNIKAKIICLGEYLSVAIINVILKAKLHNITIINPVKKFLAKGNNYLNASIDIKISQSKIHSMNIPKNHIILMAGFTAGNKKQETVILGRNGSDYSAAILSTCFKNSTCEIWTDVDGIYTCDPKIISNAKLLPTLSYQEAIELSHFGAKVLHPRTIYPLKKYNILCKIKNTHNPSAIGTKIVHNNYNNECNSIKGITYLNDVTMFIISSYNRNTMIDVIPRIFSCISLAKIWVIIINQASANNSISFCILTTESKKTLDVLSNTFEFELKNKLLKPIKIINKLATISIVNSNTQSETEISKKIFSSLKKVNINTIAISKGSSKLSISIVIKNKNVILGMRAIHQEIFSNKNTIEIFLIGIGGIGKTFLQQLKKQTQYLHSKNIFLKIIGISNSKNCIINPNGLNLKNWEENINKIQHPFNLQYLLNKIKNHYLINPTIIDCTSNQNIANQYVSFINAGFHVVTPNKKANTSNLIYYKKIRSALITSKKKFFYDTNVGAGLPVIENLKQLLNTGDKLIHFKGILSGSLSFIFGQLEDGITLSQATKKAQTLGLTEPHPKDDLSGIDVARKLLILAREVGYELELKDIKIEPLLPKELYKISNVNDFIIKLKDLDETFLNKVKKAKKSGNHLKFIGIINKDGNCQVKLDEVHKNDPLYNVKNGENALVFYSKYYQPLPLILRGYGAGNNVTASGIFSDVLRILS